GRRRRDPTAGPPRRRGPGKRLWRPPETGAAATGDRFSSDRSCARPEGNGRLTSGRQALAAFGAATRNNLLTVLGGHPRTEAVTALAHESRRLIGPLHGRLRVTGVGDRHDRQPRREAGV